jgi:transcriptional regulator GlxA family with amidase domain
MRSTRARGAIEAPGLHRRTFPDNPESFMPRSDTSLPVSVTPPADGPTRVGFLLLPDFALMSYASTVEPLRAANRLSGRELYEWRHISVGGEVAVASNGASIRADHRVGESVELDVLFVCAGGNPARFTSRAVERWLRRLARENVVLGGISGGAYVLARAGLLEGYRSTIHWEHLPAFGEDFPHLAVERSLFVIDRDRLTSAGGVAALDLMLALVERDHGHDLAAAIGEWYLHTEVRLGSGPQRMALRERFGISDAKLLSALGEIERRIEEPPTREQLAALAGTSVRQLERRFARHLKTSIRAHGLHVRLDRARELLRQTTKPVLDIAVMCGFASASHFSRAYRAAYGHPPKAERQKRD